MTTINRGPEISVDEKPCVAAISVSARVDRLSGYAVRCDCCSCGHCDCGTFFDVDGHRYCFANSDVDSVSITFARPALTGSFDTIRLFAVRPA